MKAPQRVRKSYKKDDLKGNRGDFFGLKIFPIVPGELDLYNYTFKQVFKTCPKW